MSEQKHYVYTLSYPEPMGGSVFYVGKGTKDRIDEHEREAKRDIIENPYKVNVIRKIWNTGYQVVKAKLAYFATHEEAIVYEIALIFFLPGLTNLTAGGDGVSGHAEGTLQRLSDATKKLWQSDEFRQKFSEANKGRKDTEQSRQNKKAAQKGRKGQIPSEATRRKMSDAKLGQPGRPLSEAERRSLSEFHTGLKPSEATRRKLSESHKGKRPSEATRRKMSEAHKRRQA